MTSALIKHVSDASFEADVLQADTPVLVDYWAPWCGPCKMIAPLLDDPADRYQGRPAGSHPGGCPRPGPTHRIPRPATGRMMRPLRSCAAARACALALAATARAQAPAAVAGYPDRPIRLIVPFPPGGGTDILARLLATGRAGQAHWTAVDDNKAGAGATIGTGEAVKT